MKHLAFIAVFLCTAFATAGEVEEVRRLAPKYGAEVEVRLWDGTRVDMLNDEYAFEADWDHKWAEGIGQALYYSIVTGKKPAVLLLCKDRRKSGFFIYRAQTVCAKYDVKLFVEWVDVATGE